jgi:GntR family transcriptional regulator
MILYIHGIHSKDKDWGFMMIDVVISNSDPKPIYKQITDQIKNQIITGVLQPGDALPSMRVLAKELRISVITTKRAYSELEHDGFVETVGGKGCFVAAKNREFLREEHLRKVEESLQTAVDIAKRGGITLVELKEILSLLYGQDN